MSPRAGLEAEARGLGQALPPLLAAAEVLAATVLAGDHGRKRPGRGDEFWQYRPAALGDPARLIDWRRSGRSDQFYVREREWQAAQSLTLWVDQGQSLGFSSAKHLPEKRGRARLLALALAILALRGGERVALLGQRPRAGRAQAGALAAGLIEERAVEHDRPDPVLLPDHGWAVFFSDFLGDIETYRGLLAEAAGRGLRGIMVQVLDPAEESFPYQGRVIFRSMGESLRHETQEAAHLREAYLARLAKRKSDLQTLARSAGWRFFSQTTEMPAQDSLLPIYQAMGAGR